MGGPSTTSHVAVDPTDDALAPSRTALSRHPVGVLDLHRLLRDHNGLIATHELSAVGVTRPMLASMLRRGMLIRVRQGWYSTPDLAVSVRQAARVGGVLTCGAALRAHGIWALEDDRLHVLVRRGSSRLRHPGDPRRRLSEAPAPSTVVHWLDGATTISRLIACPVDALETYRRCATHELYLAALDSTLHRRPDLRGDLIAAGHRIGPRTADGICESGTETLFRLRMRRQLPRLKCQVPIPGVGRVDFLIGEALVIEIDGRAFHDSESAFENDRRRDAELSRQGFRVLRFSYRQITDDWASVAHAVLEAVSRGDHLR